MSNLELKVLINKWGIKWKNKTGLEIITILTLILLLEIIN